MVDRWRLEDYVEFLYISEKRRFPFFYKRDIRFLKKVLLNDILEMCNLSGCNESFGERVKVIIDDRFGF